MTEARPFHLFQAVGVELEYMIVDGHSLAVLPAADRLLTAQAGALTDEVTAGPLRWSNELVLHVVELKTNGPATGLSGLAAAFQDGVETVNRHLGALGGRLMPTAMHPWMDPLAECRLWPHDNSPIYQAYDRIFDCRGHGWANLQSCHLNLPFADDEEFGRLHAAVRLLLPILPALAASSPIMDGRPTGLLDNRLQVYRDNQKRIPLIAGRVIPEPVFTRRDYRRQILRPIYRAIAPFDRESVLQDEWLNSRGAIARFQRHTIEIRTLDVQECPKADLAIAALIVTCLKAMVGERWQSWFSQKNWPVDPLAEILTATIRDGEQALIVDPAYLAQFGLRRQRATAWDLWRHLVATLSEEPSGQLEEHLPTLKILLDHGPLARRIVRALGPEPRQNCLAAVYDTLCDCLANGRMFLP